MGNMLYDQKIFELLNLFCNTLPIYRHVERQLTMLHPVTLTNLTLSIKPEVILQSPLTVFNGRGLLQGQPILLGDWLVAGQKDTKALVDGLKQLIEANQQHYSVALMMSSDSYIQAGCSVSFFHVLRLTPDNIVAEPRLIDSTMRSLHLRTVQLVEQIETILLEWDGDTSLAAVG